MAGLYVSNLGYVDHVRIHNKIFPNLEHGTMSTVHGIVVHQTDARTAASTFENYSHAGANGAHFLIDKDGTIYQTASVKRVTWHVGKRLSRCIVKKTCPATEFKAAFRLSADSLNARERVKAWPNRFPDNSDAIGIELVGISSGPEKNKVYEPVTDAQNASLKWLISQLEQTLGVSTNEVYRHPEVAHKNLTEASTAKW